MTIKILTSLYLCLIPLYGFPSIPTEKNIQENWMTIKTIPKVIEDMTLEEKIGQLLMVHFNGESLNDDARLLIQNLYVGGFIYYNWANGLDTPLQVRQLSTELQQAAEQNPQPIPLFIAIDQEGGAVSRLANGFTVFPGNCALGMTRDPQLAEYCAYAIGQELQAVGVNFNLSPVVDVNNSVKSPLIGIRTFSDSPEAVVEFTKSTLKGYQAAGIITALKHFPGHGDVEIDSHEDLPFNDKSREELFQNDLYPFIQLAGQADTIMTAHLIATALDPVNCATLSKASLDVLRNELDFKGAIISDSLVMDGLLKNCDSIDEAAVRALNAGCDILLLGGKHLAGKHKDLEVSLEDIVRIHGTLADAVRSGRISEDRLDEAVHRILHLKICYLSNHSMLIGQPLDLFVNTQKNCQLAEEIANRSVQFKINKSMMRFDVAESQIALFAPEIMKHSINQTSLPFLGSKNESLFFKELIPNDHEIKKAKELTRFVDIIVFCTYNAWRNDKQIELVNSLMEMGKPVIIIVLRDPSDANLFPDANLIITTFSPTTPSIQAATNHISNPNLWD